MARIKRQAAVRELKRLGRFEEYDREKTVLWRKFQEEGRDPREAEQIILAKFLGEGWRPDKAEPGEKKERTSSRSDAALQSNINLQVQPYEAADDRRIPVEEYEDRRGSYLETIQWVSKNIGVTHKDRLTDYPPSREAVTMLNSVNMGNLSERDFWNMWTRIAAASVSKDLFDGEAGGQSVLELIEEIEKTSSDSLLPPDTEGVLEESCVPA